MNLFFWRIFLSFWLANVLIAGALIWTTGWIVGRDGLRLPERMQEYMVLSLNEHVRALELGGLEALRRHEPGQGKIRRGPRRPALIQPEVFDESGQQLIERGPRGRGRIEYESATVALEQDGAAVVRGRKILAARASAPDGQAYVIALASRGPPNPFFALDSKGSRLRFVIALITSGAISFALARYFARPIRRLRFATQQLAAGDLTAQVDVPKARRGDDLVQLGRDFNEMARKLQKSNEAQTQLMLDVSHELRSPLARLSVAVDLLRRKTGDESTSELERIELEATRLDGLIGEILTLTRQRDRAGHAARAEQVNLADLLAEVCDDGRFEAGSPNAIQFRDETESALIRGSAESLRRCFENIIRNAIRYGAQPVSVTLAEHAGQYCVTVTDSGEGVAGAELGQLFEPFYRGRDHAENGGAPQAGGFGLGLAIVKAVIDAHGGEVTAQSPAGEGLTIRVVLPAYVAHPIS